MNKVFFLSKANIDTLDEHELSEISDSLRDKTENLHEQKDLMKIISVLVSTGINKNEDVFLKEELLPVRDTGAHKPMNIEHNENKIVGHMVKTFITTKAGKILNNEDISKNSVPKEFDITNEAVFYKFLFPELAESIKEMAEAGKLFVSVEMWFSDYDYFVGSKIVKRNKATSQLDDVLKINGGPGKINGMVVGRVLRGLLIGGIGIVEHPANTESVIKSVSSINETKISNLEEVFVNNIIGDIREEDFSMVNAPTDEFKEIAEASQAKDAEEQKEKEINKLKEALPEAVCSKIDSLVESNEKLQKSNQDLNDRVRAFEIERVTGEREKVLVEKLNIKEDFAKTEASRLSSMTKEEFEEHVQSILSYFNNNILKSESTVKDVEVSQKEETNQGGGSEDSNAQEVKASEDNTDDTKDKTEADNTSTVEDKNKTEDKVELDDIFEDSENVDLTFDTATDEKGNVLVGDFVGVLSKLVTPDNKRWKKI